MASTGQRTHSLSIDRLKGIRNLVAISFEDKPLTGIFGPNCVGKSTILHALATAYSAPEGCVAAANYRAFFPPLSDDVWNGTRFVINHTYSTGQITAQGTVEYRKGTATTWWCPIINSRPQRHVTYVGIKSCVPDLEAYVSHDLRHPNLTPCIGAPDRRVMEAASKILNHNYTAIAELTLRNNHRRHYSVLTRGDLGGQSYPSVTMGAGEQRLIRLLYAFEQTRKKGLILVDELDLMLHGDALKKLITYLYDKCVEREQQLVFTSHREELLSLTDHINIRHIHPLDGKHFCYANTDPDSMHRMTGTRVRPLELFVEDYVAEAIANRVAETLGMGRYVQTTRFGPASNCFTVLTGLLVKGEPCDRCLFVLDGDVYLDPVKRKDQINAACSGEGARERAFRVRMPALIKDFVLPNGSNPEAYLHYMICNQPVDTLETSDKEVVDLAKTIMCPADQHGYIYYLVKALGDDRQAQLTRVVRLASKHQDWSAFTAPIREWLSTKKTELALP